MDRITPEHLAALKQDHEIDPQLAAHVEREPVYNERGQFVGYDLLFDVESSNAMTRDYLERKRQKEQDLEAKTNAPSEQSKRFLSGVPEWLIGIVIGLICAIIYLALHQAGIIRELPKLPVPLWLIGLVVTIFGYALSRMITKR